jgi:hypothetical protein
MSVCIQYETAFVQSLLIVDRGYATAKDAVIKTKFRQCINSEDKVLTRMDKSRVFDASGDGRLDRAPLFQDNLSSGIGFAPSVRENA